MMPANKQSVAVSGCGFRMMDCRVKPGNDKVERQALRWFKI
jgi:hypothetical protein